MFRFHRSTVSLLLVFGCLLPLMSCANSNLGQTVQDSLAADPKLRETAPDGTLSTIAGDSSTTQVQLPAGFPTEIPRYPGAELREVTPSSTDVNQSTDQQIITRWFSQDGSDRVLAFYQQELQTNNWKLSEAPQNGQPSTSVVQQLVAQQNDLQLTVTIKPNAADSGATSPSPTPTSTESPTPNPTGSPFASPTPTDSPTSAATGTEFTIQYVRESIQAGQSPTPTVSPTNQPQEAFLGASGTSDAEVTQGTEPTGARSGADPEGIAPLSSSTFTDLNKAPKELQQYITDLAQLGTLSLSAGTKANPSAETFQPNKPISRREYARWLFATYNRLYADQAAQQIRPAQTGSKLVFRDVPASDPDFAAIQGLAEAGIIPSSLSGSSTTVTFRPDAQLSRETLLLWKVPMDTRQALPTANLNAIQQTWGFQDTARIDPKAQQAVLADYQNSDLANIRRAFGYTTLFQPKKPVTRAEAAATLWYFGYQGEGVSAQEALKQGGKSEE